MNNSNAKSLPHLIQQFDDQVKRSACIAMYLRFHDVELPNRPSDHLLNEIDVMKINFSRYTLRTMYFAEQTIEWLKKVLHDLNSRSKPSDNDFMTSIDDRIFYYFDAFVLSCKVLTERNINDKGRQHFHSSIRDKFARYVDNDIMPFMLNYANPIRNEIAHLNAFGTSLGSMLRVQGSSIAIVTMYSPESNLIILFDEVLSATSKIVFDIAQFIMIHDCELYGYPTKDITFNSGAYSIKRSEFVEIKPK